MILAGRSDVASATPHIGNGPEARMNLELPHWNRNGCMLPVSGSYCPNLYTYPQYGVLSDRIPTSVDSRDANCFGILAFPIPEASPHLRVREFVRKSRICTNFIDLENGNKIHRILGLQPQILGSASRCNPSSFAELLQLGRVCNRWEQSSCHNYCRESDLHSCGKLSNSAYSIILYPPSLDLHRLRFSDAKTPASMLSMPRC